MDDPETLGPGPPMDFIICPRRCADYLSSHPISTRYLPCLMSSTTSTTTSPSFPQLIIDALDNYTKQTGIDLTTNPFSDKLQLSDFPDGIMELFQERAGAFKECGDGNRKLVNSLQPTVQIIHALSGTLGEAISLVSCMCFIHSVRLFDDYLYRSHFHQQKQSSSALMFSSKYVPLLSSLAGSL